MKKVKEDIFCSGCMQCIHICDKNAIEINVDKGYSYPFINEDKCIKCMKCVNKCPFVKEKVENKTNKIKEVYAVKNENKNTLYNSTSGGFFTSISNLILNNNGVVYAALLDSDNNLMHVRTTSTEVRDKMRGSKYIQSDISNVFHLIKKDLESKMNVLFVGTPCQVHSIKLFLDKDYSNLLLIDFVCHGVSSNSLFKDYISYLNSKNKVIEFKFRSKLNGWKENKSVIRYENKDDYKSVDSQVFMGLYSDRLITRPSCHNCLFTSVNRVADITMGDFWGINELIPEFYDNNGVSLVLLNTDLGINYFNRCEGLIIKKSSIEGIHNTPLYKSFMPSLRREKFWNDYNKKDFKFLLNNYTKKNLLKYYSSKLLIDPGLLNYIKKKFLKNN